MTGPDDGAKGVATLKGSISIAEIYWSREARQGFGARGYRVELTETSRHELGVGRRERIRSGAAMLAIPLKIPMSAEWEPR